MKFGKRALLWGIVVALCITSVQGFANATSQPEPIEKSAVTEIEESQSNVKNEIEISAPSSSITKKQLTLSSGISSQPIIRTSNSGEFNLAWTDWFTTEDNNTQLALAFKTSNDKGNKWTADKPIVWLDAPATYVDMAVDSANIAIVWEASQQFSVIFSSDKGDTWSSPYTIYGAEFPSVAVIQNDAYVVSKQGLLGTPFVSTQKLTWAPGSSTPTTQTLNPGGWQYSTVPKVQISNDTIHIVIADSSTSAIYHYSSSDDGTSWDNNVIASCHAVDDARAMSFTTRYDKLCVAWSDYTDSTYQIKCAVSQDNGLAWEAPFDIQTATDSFLPVAEIDSQERIIVAWDDAASSSIKHAIYGLDGTIIEDSTTLSTVAPETVANPTMALDQKDRWYTIWEDISNFESTNELYIATNQMEFDIQLDLINDCIKNIPPEAFEKNPEQRRNALLEKMDAVETMIYDGDYNGAIQKLKNDIRTKMDGSIDGNPKNDWIVDSVWQNEMDRLISGLVMSLQLKMRPFEPHTEGSWSCDIGESGDTTIQMGLCILDNTAGSGWSAPIPKTGGGYYRAGSQWAKFLLNVPNTVTYKNIECRITFTYYASQDVTLMQFYGPSYNYAVMGTLPAASNWKVWTIETKYNLNYDYYGHSDFNILIQFNQPLNLDLLAAVEVRYQCDVGTSGDNIVINHNPGICLHDTEWSGVQTIDGRSCKIGSFSAAGNGPNFWINSPKVGTTSTSGVEYRIEIVYKTTLTLTTYLNSHPGYALYLQQYGGSWPYNNLIKLSTDEQWHTSIAITNHLWYYDADGNSQYWNVLFQIGFSPVRYDNIGEIITVDTINITVARDYCDVGTDGDTNTTAHEPGISVFPSEWSDKTTRDGMSCRYKDVGGANLLINGVNTEKDYVVRIKYRCLITSSTPGKFRTWDGLQYRDLGEYKRDNVIRDETFIVKAFWFNDVNELGYTSEMNVFLDFSTEITLYDVSVGVMEKYAILIGGGDTNGPDNHPAFTNDFFEMYSKLKAYQDWKDENIYAYLWDKTNTYDQRIDGNANISNLRFAIMDIGRKITYDDLFFFVEICHGFDHATDGSFQLYNTTTNFEDLIMFSISKPSYPVTLKSLLDTCISDRYARMIFIAQSCYSGHAVTNLASHNRIIMSASQSHEMTYTNRGNPPTHWAFICKGSRSQFPYPDIPGFLLTIGASTDPRTLEYGFDNGCNAAVFNGNPSNPQVYNHDLSMYTYL
ncbi:MAG: hypothetical protein HZB92_01950 [Euryarchaeota archaeon]|nr:hypothetical protein [Euryarchaeota archaeon]